LFEQVGDQFYYVGDSIDNLIEKLSKNTFAIVDEAQHQLDAYRAFSKGLDSDI
jgi:hypothetical protein